MKTNKTKPIKKLMIFTIITVMIVSLFAVPAFASSDWVEWPALSDTEIEPETLYINGGTSEVSTEGMYAFTVTSVAPDGDGAGSYNESNPLVPFPVDDYMVGYIKLIDETGTYYYAINTPGGNALFYVSNYGTVFYEFWTYSPMSDQYSKASVNSGEVISLTFYFYEYPPDFNDISSGVPSETQWLWERIFPISATAVKVRSNTPEPDPEEPTDPTPPADGEEQGIFAVWSQITQWIVQGLASVSNAFYADGKLTLLGYLCIIPLALGLAFLLIGIIQKFLRLRG